MPTPRGARLARSAPAWGRPGSASHTLAGPTRILGNPSTKLSRRPGPPQGHHARPAGQLSPGNLSVIPSRSGPQSPVRTPTPRRTESRICIRNRCCTWLAKYRSPS